MKRIAIFSAFALCVLSPYLLTGYYHDDKLNSLLPSYLQAHHLTIGQYIAREIRRWTVEEARLFPLTLVTTYSTWYFTRDLLLYRLTQLSLVLSNILLFMALVHSFGGGKRLALLTGMCVLALFQLRAFPDPIASFAHLMQIAMGLGAGSLLLLHEFQKTARGWMLFASLGLFACSLLFYETATCFVPILAYVAWKGRRTGRLGLLARWGHLALTGAYLVAVVLLRLHYPSSYPGIQTHLRLKALATFAWQFSAALPLSHPLFGKSGFFPPEIVWTSEFLSWHMLAIFAAGFALFKWFLDDRSSERSEARDDRSLLPALAWTLAIAPSLLISVSHKYQEWVNRPGIGYLPVYLSCFGVALLMARAIERAKRRRLISVVMAAVLAITYATNLIAADRLNGYWKYPRVLLERALRQDMLAELPDDAQLVLKESVNCVTPDLIISLAGRNFDFLNEITYATQPERRRPTAYLLEMLPQGSTAGKVLLSRIQGVQQGHLRTVLVRSLEF